MDRQPSFHLDPNTGFLADKAGQALCAAIENEGYSVFFVGGCVRNAVMDAPASDVDLSTDAEPDLVMKIAKAQGYKAIPTGMDHGTVTVVVKGEPYEITTFRRDVATDGRRAVVAFSKDMADDARRRDFTFNALYSDRHGAVFDPVNGLNDAQNRVVRFIDDPDARLREDFLRILRFFRFSAYYADPENGWDPDALAAISENAHGLEQISAERVGAEMLKLLQAPQPSPALAVMEKTGVLNQILPGADPTLVAPVVHLEQENAVRPNAMTRLAALGGADVANRLRLSRNYQRQLESIRSMSGSEMGPKATGFLCGREVGIGAILLRFAMMNRPLPDGALDDVSEGANAVFPVNAKDLRGYDGPQIGQKLKSLKHKWLLSELTKTKSQLLGA